uniref:hypothetical protein n=1 Tax=Sphingomonas populi TaxID=2484750 RepID=UPI0013EEAA5E|nr:hypothetical protein [Sphingomonas populi]
MSDAFADAIKLQQQMLDAQKASIADTRATLEQASRDIAEANLEAMKAWARVWNVWL